MKSSQILAVLAVWFCLVLDTNQVALAVRDKIPIVYSDQYDYDLGIETKHPFASKKYSQIKEKLVTQGYLAPEAWHTPEQTTWELFENVLKTVHNTAYLNNLKNLHTQEIFDGFEFNSEHQGLEEQIAQGIMNAQIMGTEGTLKALELALTDPEHWAINLSGGYHHANRDFGSGYCLIADSAVAIKSFLNRDRHHKVLIVDLDAHFGDGNAEIFEHEKRVKIFDIYNTDIFPIPILEAEGGKRKVDFDFPIPKGTRGYAYMRKLESNLPSILEKGGFSLIYYNAGTDVLQGDIGGLGLTDKEIIARDEFVFKQARTRGIPIFMALSGGYHQKMPDIVASSIANLIKKKLILVDAKEEVKPSERSRRKQRR